MAAGRGKFAHRADIPVYPRVSRPAGLVAVEDRGVLLETGYAGGEWPSETVQITPLLCEPLGIEPDEFEDTAAFDVRALLPARTLLEKLSLLHHVADEHVNGTTPDTRCGRHYCDVYRLLDHAPTRKALKDRAQFDRIMSDMEQFSRSTSARGSPVLKAAAKVTGQWPSFGTVLVRVAEWQQLL